MKNGNTVKLNYKPDSINQDRIKLTHDITVHTHDTIELTVSIRMTYNQIALEIIVEVIFSKLGTFDLER